MSFSEIYVMGAQRHVQMASGLTLPSEASGHEIVTAFDHDFDSFWEPTSTDDQTIDLDMGQPKDMIADQGARYFAGGSNWVNVNFASFNQSGDLSVTADAIGQSCNLPQSELTYDWLPGKTYQLRYDADLVSGTLEWRTDSEGIGTVVDGTTQTVSFTPTNVGNTLRLVSLTNPAQVNIDNMSIVVVDDIYKVDAFGFWLHNHRMEHGLTGAPTITVMTKDVLLGSDGPTFMTKTFADLQASNLFGHLVIVTGITETMKRYWLIKLIDMATVVEISHFFFLRKLTLPQQNVYPERTLRSFGNRPARGMLAGRRSVNAGSFRDFRMFQRNFKLFGDSAYDILVQAFQSSAGGALPLIIKEGDEYIPVRLLTEDFDPVLIDGGPVYTLKLTFAEIPYRDEDGGY